jgi:hypothetical protein
VSTANEIEAAIRALSPSEREKLVRNLPTILRELDGDLVWDGILNDSGPRPAFTALLDEVEAGFKKNPAKYPSVKDADFDGPP